MLENSDFLEKIKPPMYGKDQAEDPAKDPGLDKVLGSFNNTNEEKQESQDKSTADYSKYSGKLKIGSVEIENYKAIPDKEIKIRYIWSVHLSQFVMSILIGIVLQLLWEDRPVTEPL